MEKQKILDYPEINDYELENILELISLSKSCGFRNSKEIHVKCNRAEEFNSFYMYFIKNISFKLFGTNNHYRCVICVSKKKPDNVYIYVIRKHSGAFTQLSYNIDDLIKKSPNNKFQKIIDLTINNLIEIIEKRFNEFSLFDKL